MISETRYCKYVAWWEQTVGNWTMNAETFTESICKMRTFKNVTKRDMTKTKCTVGWLVGWFLWYINPCRLFNAKSCLHIYILNEYDL